MTGPAGRPAGTAAGTPAGTQAGTAAGPPARAAEATTAAAGSVEPADEPTEQLTDLPARRRLPGGRRVWTIALLSVVVLTLAVALVAVARAPSDREVRESALLAARTYTTSLTTFDARTLDDDAERVRRSSTPEFVTAYDQTLAGLRESVQSDQLVSTGTVVGVGLEELSGDTATVLVAVDQQLQRGAEQPRTEANRLRMTLLRADGRWLIRDVERL